MTWFLFSLGAFLCVFGGVPLIKAMQIRSSMNAMLRNNGITRRRPITAADIGYFARWIVTLLGGIATIVYAWQR